MPIEEGTKPLDWVPEGMLSLAALSEHCCKRVYLNEFLIKSLMLSTICL